MNNLDELARAATLASRPKPGPTASAPRRWPSPEKIIAVWTVVILAGIGIAIVAAAIHHDPGQPQSLSSPPATVAAPSVDDYRVEYTPADGGMSATVQVTFARFRRKAEITAIVQRELLKRGAADSIQEEIVGAAFNAAGDPLHVTYVYVPELKQAVEFNEWQSRRTTQAALPDAGDLPPGYERVKGYTKKNGTWVAGYSRRRR